MKKIIYLSIIGVMAINASAVDLGTLEVLEVTDTKIIENVSQQEVKNADLAETLHKRVPSINLIRRSGIANDITLRGQKRDNITVTIDDSKVCGACPNRMDPPTSHIVTANIESIKVSEGPFDVENFGSLSGSIKIKTKKPSKGMSGEIETTLGSFGYKKIGANLSGGSDSIKILITGSYETSQQYEDGDGNSMAEQLANANTITAAGKNPEFQSRYEDMDAYEKKTFMAKTFINITDKQNIELSYTKNKSDNILYPNSKMDALYDDSDILNFKYILRDLGLFSKALQIKAYNSKVEHPMSTKYRTASDSNIADTIDDSNNEVVSKLTTDMTGVKIINDMVFDDDKLTIGLDASRRNWNGKYIGYGTKVGLTGLESINDVDTANNAIFAKYSKNIDKLNIKTAFRVNDTTISTANTDYKDIDFNSVDANILATYKSESATKYFIGLGKASRVPDGRELYFNSSMNKMSGTPTLNQTTNTEVDLGIEQRYDNAYIKVKAFYSKLDNYIYFNKGNTMTFQKMTATYKVAYNSFENIGATIYGLELNGAYDINDDIYIDFGASYQVGQKDEAMTSTNINTITSTTTITNQENKDLADITPLKINIALHYDYDKELSTKIELAHAQAWDKYDEDNGEQELDSYSIVNIKAKKSFGKSIDMTLGIDNLFDTTYAVSNTYSDLILLSDGISSDVMLLNEPGRYIYANLKYKF